MDLPMDEGLEFALDQMTPSSIMESAVDSTTGQAGSSTPGKILSSQADAQAQTEEGRVSAKLTPIEYTVEPETQAEKSIEQPTIQSEPSVTNVYNTFNINSGSSTNSFDTFNSLFSESLGLEPATPSVVVAKEAAKAAGESKSEVTNSTTNTSKETSVTSLETQLSELFGLTSSSSSTSTASTLSNESLLKILAGDYEEAPSTDGAEATMTNPIQPTESEPSTEVRSTEPSASGQSTNNLFKSAVSVESNSPIKNKSTVNQIMNPPNPIAQGIDSLGQTITNTSNNVASTISKSMSNITQMSTPIAGSTTQYFNETNSNTVSQIQPGSAKVEPSIESKNEPTIQSSGLSEYYLHAIYDALVGQGIKIRTI